MEGLEPTRLAAPDPKSGAATNYATSAYQDYHYFKNTTGNFSPHCPFSDGKINVFIAYYKIKI